VLSGFLITGILLRMKETLPARQYFQKFYGRRILRIFPLYYFYLIILTVAFIFCNSISFEPLRNELQNIVGPQLPYAYFYVYDFFFASSAYTVTSFLTHLWSLAVEEQFYIIWPLILFLVPKEKMKRLFLSAIILGPAFRLLTYFVYSNHLFPFQIDNPYLAVYVLPFSHVDAFAFGAYISQFEFPNPRRQLAILVFAVPLLGYLTQYLSVGIIDLGTLGYEFKMFTAYKFVWGYSLLNYLFALIIQNVYRLKRFLWIFDSFPLRYLGKISYGIYVYHIAVLWFVTSVQFAHLNQFFTYLMALALTVIVSSLSFYSLEKPISDLKDKFFSLRAS
jgi:peptidoglycan/LPS O-acetylase OafA/YrhL